MLRYVDTLITFSEVPDEVSLSINLSNCPIHCPDCHSKYLWNDVGTELTIDNLKELLDKNQGVSCICFMGGDSDPVAVNNLSKWVHANTNLKTCWYSGRDAYPTFVPDFDYLKIGSYMDEYGPLNVKTTNQKMVEIIKTDGRWYMKDITYKFWKND
jgi:anaerobic ribonucleoside-triphosphate reductase activating protein